MVLSFGVETVILFYMHPYFASDYIADHGLAYAEHISEVSMVIVARLV